MERVYDALCGAGLVSDGQHTWSGKFNTINCPACGERGGMWFGTIEGRFKVGCRNNCGRLPLLHSIGLDGFDAIRLQPRFLRVRGTLSETPRPRARTA